MAAGVARSAVGWTRAHPSRAAYVGATAFAIWAVYDTLALRAEKEFAASLDCLALNIYHEARGEPADSQLAVAVVVMNRVAHQKFPDTVCDVIKQGGAVPQGHCQFSWWCDGKSDLALYESALERSRRLARVVLRGKYADPTDGSLWYHAISVSPAWSKDFVTGPTIGRHVFYVPATGS